MKQTFQNFIILCLISFMAITACEKDDAVNLEEIEINDSTDTPPILAFDYSFFPYFENSVFQFEKIYTNSDNVKTYSTIIHSVESFNEETRTSKVVSSTIEGEKDESFFFIRKLDSNKVELSTDNVEWNLLIDVNENPSNDFAFLLVGKARKPNALWGFVVSKCTNGSFTTSSGSYPSIKNTSEYDASTNDSYLYTDKSIEVFVENIGLVTSNKTYVDWSIGYPYLISLKWQISLTGYKIYLLNGDILEDGIVEDDSTIPNAPNNLSSNRTSTISVQLEWADISLNESGFEIERREYDIGNFALISTNEMNENSYTDNTIESEKKYQYRVRAINVSGNSDYTNEVDVNSYGFPKAPWDLTTSYNSSTFDAHFTWWARYSDNIDHFQFAYYENELWTDLNFTFPSNPTGVSNDIWQEDGIMNYGGEPWPAGTHSFKVKAVNSVGESFYSEPVDLVITKKSAETDIFDSQNIKNK